MTTFGYYSTKDSTEEIIAKKQFNCWMDALMYWSEIKQLTPAVFGELFTIKEIK